MVNLKNTVYKAIAFIPKIVAQSQNVTAGYSIWTAAGRFNCKIKLEMNWTFKRRQRPRNTKLLNIFEKNPVKLLIIKRYYLSR
jgi:hypothetical protein